MAQLVVRNLEERVKAGLLRRAKRNRRSMEEEVRTILRRSVLADEGTRAPLGSRLEKRFARVGLDRALPALPRKASRAALFDE